MTEKEKVFYTADGVVLGNYWGGGRGWYPAEKYIEDTFTTLKGIIKKDFGSGALDSGMGYESLVGAMMVIVKHTTIEYKGKEFDNETRSVMWLGKVNKRRADEEYNNIEIEYVRKSVRDCMSKLHRIKGISENYE